MLNIQEHREKIDQMREAIKELRVSL